MAYERTTENPRNDDRTITGIIGAVIAIIVIALIIFFFAWLGEEDVVAPVDESGVVVPADDNVVVDPVDVNEVESTFAPGLHPFVIDGVEVRAV